MNYITVDENKKITGHYSGNPDGIPIKQNERLVEVGEANEVVVGLYEDEFDHNFKQRPLKDRVADGTARWVPDTMTLAENENELRLKTQVELVRDGIIELLPNEKIEGDQVVEKNWNEKLADGLVTQAEYNQHVIQERSEAERAEILSKMPDWLIQGLTWEEMQAEVQKIKNRSNG